MSGFRGVEPSRWAISPKQREWAYRKWCEGHPPKQIAQALNVSPASVYRYLDGMERKWIPLVYEEEIKTMKVLLVKPHELAEVVEIPNELKTLQELVGGYIEVVEAAGCALIVDEEGLIKGKEHNLSFEQHHMQVNLHGNIIICGIDGEDFTDLSELQLEHWDSWILTERAVSGDLDET